MRACLGYGSAQRAVENDVREFILKVTDVYEVRYD